MDWVHLLPESPAEPVLSLSAVLIYLAVWGPAVSILVGVGQAFPVGLFVVARTQRVAQVTQGLGGVLLLEPDPPLCPLMLEVVPKVLQVQGPRAQLLPVHPLEGHDTV